MINANFFLNGQNRAYFFTEEFNEFLDKEVKKSIKKEQMSAIFLDKEVKKSIKKEGNLGHNILFSILYREDIQECVGSLRKWGHFPLHCGLK